MTVCWLVSEYPFGSGHATAAPMPITADRTVAVKSGFTARQRPLIHTGSLRPTLVRDGPADIMVHANDAAETIALCNPWIHVRTTSDRRAAFGGARRLQIGFGRHDQTLRHSYSRLHH